MRVKEILKESTSAIARKIADKEARINELTAPWQDYLISDRFGDNRFPMSPAEAKTVEGLNAQQQSQLFNDGAKAREEAQEIGLLRKYNKILDQEVSEPFNPHANKSKIVSGPAIVGTPEEIFQKLASIDEKFFASRIQMLMDTLSQYDINWESATLIGDISGRSIRPTVILQGEQDDIDIRLVLIDTNPGWPDKPQVHLIIDGARRPLKPNAIDQYAKELG